jgi:hypothetical protein
LARVSVCISVDVSVGGWFFLFVTELATEMGFTGRDSSVTPSVLLLPTDFIAVTDGISLSVKLDNVVVFILFRNEIVEFILNQKKMLGQTR